MNELHFIKPYTDQFLKWNEDTKRYELTLEYVKLELDINFRNDDMTQKRSKQNSRKIYNFIKYRMYSGNARYLELLLNYTEEGRKFLKDVLMEQFDADNENAYNDLSKQPAIDFGSGRSFEREQIQANQISVDTEQVIETNPSYFGFNIMIAYAYPCMVNLILQGGMEQMGL